MLRQMWRNSNFAQVGNEYTYVQLYMYVQGRQTDIQTPTHRNLTGRSMTAPAPMLSPSSILPPRSSNCAVIPPRKNSMGV